MIKHFNTINYSYIDTFDVAKPECFITLNKNRIKQHENNTVYLKNGDEFEIELYNPRKTKVLAKIKLDGKPISNSGIILRPAERVYLERFLDSDNKFKFDTYNIDSSDESMRATKNNGLVEIDFYYEVIIKSNNQFNYNTNWFYTGTTYKHDDFTIPNEPIGGQRYGSLSLTNNSKSRSIKETGTTEKGSKSDQVFIAGNGEFSVNPNMIVDWKIKPKSTKPITSNEIKSYCTNCGYRIRKQSWNYCPKCSENLRD